MRPVHSVRLPLVVLAGFGLGADGPTVLNDKGLIRSGRTFVIEAEKPVLAKLKEARSALADYNAAAGRKDQADEAAGELARVEERRAEIQSRVDETNQRINEQGFLQQSNGLGAGLGGGGRGRPGASNGVMAQNGYLTQLIAQRDMMRRGLNELATATSTLKSLSADRKSLDEGLKKKAAAAKEALSELRPMVDDVTKQYDRLAADASVKAAIRESGTLKLGPSDAFKAAVKALDQAERRLLGRSTPSVARKKAKSRR